MRTWFFKRFVLPRVESRAVLRRGSATRYARLGCEELEERDVPAAPLILSTTPSAFFTGGVVPSWTTTVSSTTTVDTVIKVTFDSSRSPTSQSAALATNYQVFDVTTNSAVGIAGVSYASSSQTATITLSTALPVNSDTYTLTVKDTIVASDGSKLDGDANGTAGGDFVRTFTVGPKSFAVAGFPNTITSGTPASYTVTAMDAAGAIAAGYRGTVHFTSADSKAVLPADYTFTAADAGSHTFTATLINTGNKSITATDTANSAITGKQSNITVNPGVVASFSMSLPSASTAGTAFSVTVTAKDASGNTLSNYQGTVHFTSTDSQAVLPADYTFTAADAGSHTFTFTLKTAGSKSIAVTDTTAAVTKSSSSTVAPAAFSQFAFTPPATVTTGSNFSLKLTAKDAYGNTVTGYTGTVHFTSSDATAFLPADYTFTAADAGVKSVNMTLNAGGSQTVTASDAAASVTSSITITPIPIRFSAASNTIYVTGNVTVTLSDILAAVPTAPLSQVDTTNHIWFLKANLILQQGATLNLKGTAIGGDVNELRLMSDNVAGAANNIVKISADWGNVYIDGVRVTSWDEAVNGADTEVATYGRAFIQVRSSLDADGTTVRESRMDINNSDIGYLGYDASEAYGLSWKVTGDPGAAMLDADGNPTFALFEKVNVYGNITNSHIHNNWFGMFSFGAYGMQILNNEVDHSIGYGLDPHDDSDYLLIQGNYVHHNGYDGIIVSKRCDHVSFINNISAYNAQNGLFFHYQSNDGIMEGNQALYNGIAGITVLASTGALIQNNTIIGNAFGIKLTEGSSDNIVQNNDISGSTQYGLYLATETSPTFMHGDGRQRNNQFLNNNVHDNGSYAIRSLNSDDTLFQGNTFTNNASTTLSFDDGQRNRLNGNTLQSNQLLVTNSSYGLASSTYVSNEPEIRVNPDSLSSIIFDDTTGHAFDLLGLVAPTTITSTSSVLTVTRSTLGTLASGKVLMRNLNVVPTTGTSVGVNTSTWETTGVRRKEWSSQTATADQPITYTVGDLLPGTPYVILKNGVMLAQLTANSSGIVTFTDTPGTTSAITYSVAADAASFGITPISAAVAGQAQSFTLSILDALGQVVTNYVGTVHFTTTDPLGVVPADYTFTAADAGTKVFSATFKTAGSQSITAVDASNPNLTVSEADIAVYAGAPKRFVVGGIISPIVAGTPSSVTITVQDAYGNLVDGYTGTVHFMSTDLQAVLPADYTFTASDAGVATFPVMLKSAGARTLTVTDIADATVLGKLQGITVTPASAASFVVSGFSDPIAAGTPGGFTVVAKDLFGNVANDYAGTVHFTSTDSLAVLPADYTFTLTDAGVHSFAATLYTVGSRAIIASDSVSGITGQQSAITVTAATQYNFTITGLPANPQAGVPASIAITVRDQFGNVATNYTGTVHFSSSDLQAVLPADFTFTAANFGTKIFPVTLKTAGTQSLSVTDGTATSQVTAQVAPAAVKAFAVSGIVNPVTAGTTQTLTVTAQDLYGNTVANYVGTVHFTSTDLAAILPADYTFVADDQGTHTFVVTLVSAGTRTVTATDTANATVLGKQQGIAVVPAAATSFVVGGFADPVTAGTPSGFTVTAKDAYGNAATGYVGTVQFTSTDPFAVLPADYTFTAADSGTHTFNATLFSAGSQTITATDGVQYISGRQSAIDVQPQAFTTVVVQNYPTTTMAGVSQSIEVRILDVFGNLVSNYTGTVHFTSSDLQAVLPADYTFTPGDHGDKIFSVTMKTAGLQSISVSDIATGLSGTQTGIAVTANVVKRFGVVGDITPPVAGSPYSFTVTAQDTYGNPTSYQGTVHITSTDLAAILPADYTFTAADNGVHTFSTTFYSAGLRTITATDTVDATMLGKQQNIAVQGAAASYFVVNIPSTVQTGSPFDVTISAKDVYGNFTQNYLGTVHFTSSDLGAFLPADYTFTSADLGTHTFTAGASLAVTGIKNVQATDTVNAAITGKMSTQVTASPYIWVPATNTIYISGITVTLTDIHNLLPTAPLTLLDATNHIWRLDANLMLLNGATLNIHGSSMGGDVDELRLRSENTLLSDGTPAPNNTIWIKAVYGDIDIRYTKITSWDDAINGPDVNPGQVPPRDDDEGDDNNGVVHERSYIAVISIFADDGVTPLTSRMDIDHSDIGYLGSHTTTGYGLSWKADGFGAEVHSRLHVYGSVTDSHIHNNFFGIYTYGGYDMDFLNNEVDHNIWYGIDPHDDTSHSRFMYNYTHDNGTHGLILSQRCDYNIIAYNISEDNAHHGIMLHRSSNHNEVYGNIVTDNGDVGIAIYESFDNNIYDNTVLRNYKGVRFSMGPDDNTLTDNEIAFNTYAGIDMLSGSDAPYTAVNPDNRADHNTISNNYIHDNGIYALRVTYADNNTITGNTFANESSILFGSVIDNTFSNNTLPSNLVVSATGSVAFPTNVIVQDQSAITILIDPFSSFTFGGAAGSILDTGSLGLSTLVQPISGSQLKLTQAITGILPVTVKSVNLDVDTPTGASRVYVTPISFPTDPSSPRSWTTQQVTGSDVVTYIVSGLTAGSTYVLKQNGVVVSVATASTAGTVQYQVAAGTSASVTFSVEKSLAPNLPNATAANVKYSSSTITVTGAVIVTPTLLQILLPAGVIDLVDPVNKVWYLKANLVLKQGAALVLLGTSVGGDVNTLRLRSNNSSTTGQVVSIKADWGQVIMDSVKVTSWNDATNSVMTTPGTGGRAYIQVTSSLGTGNVAQESTMNINNSEISFLGSSDSKSGVYWTVNTTNPTVLATVHVYGKVTNSKFHDNYYGAMVKYAAGGMTWTNNEFYNNLSNGITLKYYVSGMTFDGNTIHDNVGAGIYVNNTSTGLTFTNNKIVHNTSYGITLQTGSGGTLIQGNTITDNTNYGIFISASDSVQVKNNTLLRNTSGLKLDKNSGMAIVTGNEIGLSTSTGIALSAGSGAGTNADGSSRGNTFDSNNIHDNTSKAISLDSSSSAALDNNIFRNNTITGTAAQAVSITKANGTQFLANTVGDNVTFTLSGSSTLPTSVTFTDQSKLTVKVDAYSTVKLVSTTGSTFKVGTSTISTTMSGTSSTLTLNKTTLGSSAVLITTRHLGAMTSTGTATLDSSGWSTTATASRSFVVKASSTTQALTYSVGDLTPGVAYVVKKNGVTLTTIIGGSNGSASFVDTPGSTSNVTYTITPA